MIKTLFFLRTGYTSRPDQLIPLLSTTTRLRFRIVAEKRTLQPSHNLFTDERVFMPRVWIWF
jgi:hypothetical protein